MPKYPRTRPQAPGQMRKGGGGWGEQQNLFALLHADAASRTTLGTQTFGYEGTSRKRHFAMKHITAPRSWGLLRALSFCVIVLPCTYGQLLRVLHATYHVVLLRDIEHAGTYPRLNLSAFLGGDGVNNYHCYRALLWTHL